ncbi:hypothetical protein JOD43_001304 [Pullulanibacillus pueri]|uniref:GxGYxY sequence motif-containing protein n=1 Tax=Pullulanibacillus pueri TaxID=1437324 RepID=A0A8J2ZUI8_9BACL|nr:GxGYxYP domain-containing protein [Pullulanibacillus pueri]MBM7681137.1 hypothetical protein [Pullulanibacillus pueri]GGH77189.1 hypothetical protein GCM10007096_08720 [Pullulanibacillus pueri]
MIRKFIVLSLVFLGTLSISFSAIGFSTSKQASAQSDHAITWPKKQILPSFKKAKHLDVADVSKAPGDIKILLATLQGIVNRQEPSIYLIENTEEGKMTWLNDLNVPYTVHEDYWDIVKKYKKAIQGIIVYDPQVQDSINVATTLAGLKNGVVVSPTLAKTLQAAPYHLKVITDLQGKFKDRLDAYTWQYNHLWKQTTHRMLVGLGPNKSIDIPPGLPESFKVIAEDTTQERDANNRKVYDFDLSTFLGKESVYLRFEDAFPQDGWGSAVHEVTIKADGKVIAHFIPGTSDEAPFLYDQQDSQLSDGSGGHRFADNNRYFVYKFTPPAGTKTLTASIDMWNQYKVSAGNIEPPSAEQKEPYGYLRDYAVANKAMVFWLDANIPEEKALFEKIMSDVKPGTPYLGWFSNDAQGEFNSTEIASSHGIPVIAADWFNNMTVFSGTKVTPHKANSVPTPKLENKIYVTYTFSEGDNFQYNQHRMRILWDDPARGEVPINWSSSPLLYDGAPAILNYYQQTATQNDLLIAGPSGAGYFYPNAWPENSFKDYLKQSYLYLKKSGMTIPYVLNRTDGQNVPLTDEKALDYERFYKVPGLFLSYEDQSRLSIQNGTLPVSTIHGISTVQDGKNLLAEAKAHWDGKSPLFISIGLLAWNLTPSDAVAITESLDDHFKVVRADQYFSLIRKANGLPVKK